MATIFRCDRCYSDHTDRRELRTIKLPHTDKWSKFTDEESTYNQELCNDCWMKIFDYVKPLVLEKK